ncbi:MAG: ROK family protein [Candidatus Aminicenantes bacterium]|jgi:glucokinase
MPLYAGFDFGGTQLKYGLIDNDGAIIKQAQVDSPAKVPELLQLLEKIWKDLKRTEEQAIKAVGFGIPGVLSLKEQKILQSPNYPDIDNFELVPALSRFIEVPFTINNDANMAAFGEYKKGGGMGVHSMVLLTIGTGLGTGIILEEKIWQGVGGFGGELGHATVNLNGEPCKCGSTGCLETEVSGPKIVKNYKTITQSGESLDPEDIYQRACRGDEAALEAFSTAGRFLGIGLSIAINLLNPEKILLGGGVMKAGDFLFKPAVEEARKRSFKASFECCRIERAVLGNLAGFIGSAFYAKEHGISQFSQA